MKIKTTIPVAIGLTTAIICISGVLKTTTSLHVWSYNEIAIVVLILITLLAIYIGALIKEKKLLGQATLTIWSLTWPVSFLFHYMYMNNYINVSGYFDDFYDTFFYWPLFFFNEISPCRLSLGSELWSGVIFAMITILLWTGIYGISKH